MTGGSFKSLWQGDLTESPLAMQQQCQIIADLSVPQPVQVGGEGPGEQHEKTPIERADPHVYVRTYALFVEQEELQSKEKAGNKVEKKQNPVGQHGDPRPGEAGLPNSLHPRHHVEPNVAVENHQGAGYGAHQKVHVNALHVFVFVLD